MENVIKNIAITISICSALALSATSLADNNGLDSRSIYKEAESHQAKGERRLAKLARKLGLSDSQKVEFKAVKEEEKAKMQSLKPAMDAFREQVKTLMLADSFDEPAFIELQANNQDVFAQMALIKAKSKFAMKSVLTEEQLTKLRSMKHKRSRR
ncbi:MAG: Spy/CpxP family protein refolding chaperone [Colwellia sp.]|nr:Spy/CpxP family protein refolding chaperone [Colwellia sp.]